MVLVLLAIPLGLPVPSQVSRVLACLVVHVPATLPVSCTVGELCTAESNESQNGCHIRGSPENTGRVSFGNRLTGSLAGLKSVNTGVS